MTAKANENISERFEKIGAILAKLYPDAECSLEYKDDPWRLLVMARLSAQCTDARVNVVSEELFGKYPDADKMRRADIEELESCVRSCGLYHTKARDLIGMSEMIVTEYGGRVPDTMEELLKLPGVGRKIANLILGDVYGKPGIVADTHCIRISGRFGAYPEEMKDPARAEKILSCIVKPEAQSVFCHRLVMFGRDICTARSPKCDGCAVRELCAHNKVDI